MSQDRGIIDTQFREHNLREEIVEKLKENDLDS